MKFFWNTLKLSPVILGAALLVANRTQAAETPVVDLAQSSSAATNQPANESGLGISSSASAAAATKIAEVSTPATPTAEVKNADVTQTSLQQQQVAQLPTDSSASDKSSDVTSVAQLSNQAPETLAQVTSVSQLSDVQPTDWAFQALQSLVERYGCIAGYPDRTYRGNRALTRYEFAAGLNACLDRVNELIAAATADLVRREDLATLQRLQEEFAAELATLRGRVDALEATTAQLEANQFSTTTKLTGEVVLGLSGFIGDERAVPSGRAQGSAGDVFDNATFAGRARLAFNTSFTGSDLLRTRLQARNITPFNVGVTGTDMTRLGFDGDDANTIGTNSFGLDQLFYRTSIGPVIAQFDIANTELNERGFPTLSPFESSGRGSISRYGRFSPIYRQGAGGAGASFAINPQGPISVNVAYLAPTANNPNPGFGAGNGAYAAIGQVTFKASDAFAIGLTYAHTYDTPRRRFENLFEGTGSVLAAAPFGNVATTGNHYGVEANLRLSEKFILFGWGGYTSATAEVNPTGAATNDGATLAGVRGARADIWYYAGGIALPDFGKEGSMLGLLFGQAPRVAGNDVREVNFGNRRRIDSDVSYHVEGFYRYKLNDNIDITPGVLVIINPEHNDDNPTEYVGTLRTTFTF